ncbi:MAG: hypothetical protein MJZ37_04035 [Bacilli bacterium]|nr:hypothetical protein [Bacilli bacterium]
MPHAGGGGSSGGFHSSGSSVSGSSTPRYDNQGHLHSVYYVRPGFYIHNRYVPYTSKERKSAKNFAAEIFLYVFALFMIFVLVMLLAGDHTYSESSLESYALEQYSEIYDEDSPKYEKNLLVTIIAYEDNKQYDYITIVGDDIDTTTDNFFGNENTEFGKSILNHIPGENYYSDLYKHLAESLEAVNYELSTNPVYGGSHGSGIPTDIHIENISGFGEINGKNELLIACNEFYALRGYNISFLISNNEKAYGIEWVPVVIVSISTLAMIGFATYSIIAKKKDIKTIENEIKNGNAVKYYEGEDPFEQYYKDHPID